MGNSWEELETDDVELESLISSDLDTQNKESYNQNIELFLDSTENNFSSTKLQKLSAARVCSMVAIGLVMSFALFIVVASLYTRFIRFPSEQKRIWEESILYAVENFCDNVNSAEVGVEGSYLMREFPYANDNKDRESFMKYVMSTVSYDTDIVNRKNVFGNDLVDSKSLEILTDNSWLSEGEEATVSFIDYDSLKFDSARLKELISQSGINAEDIRYSDKLADMFCQYIYNTEKKKLPIASEKHVPNVSWTGTGYEVTLEEDIYLDKLLFSSDALYSCFERFAESIANELGMQLEVSKSYTDWSVLSSANREATVVPLKYGKYSINHIWCGAYYLIEEYSLNGGQQEMIPQLGDGSKEQPASVGTPVITYILRNNSEGGVDKLPIRVTMKEYGVSQKAIDWFEAKDVQNRGFNITSEVQYCYYVFEVTNLSKETLTVYDNSTICDDNANSSGRTGTVYGLQSEVTLNPEETGIIESWNRSTELNLKYVIWGSDFARRENPVWFRVLAGDLEDPTVEKGVSLNTTRD